MWQGGQRGERCASATRLLAAAFLAAAALALLLLAARCRCRNRRLALQPEYKLPFLRGNVLHTQAAVLEQMHSANAEEGRSGR